METLLDKIALEEIYPLVRLLTSMSIALMEADRITLWAVELSLQVVLVSLALN